jgi:hypothetical protein
MKSGGRREAELGLTALDRDFELWLIGRRHLVKCC